MRVAEQESVTKEATGVRVWADGHLLRPVEGEPGLYRGVVSLSRKRLADEMLILVKAGDTAAMSIEALDQALPSIRT